MIHLFLIALISSLVLTLLFTPASKWLARKVNAVDVPNSRKVHSKPTPRLGGIAIAVSLFVSLTVFWFLFPEASAYIVPASGSSVPWQGLLVASALLLVLGVGCMDDVFELKPGPKFAVQIVAASIIYFAGFDISLITHPFNMNLVYLHWVSYPLTVIWIVGVTNAFNLIDGLDGLASGVAIIALCTIAAISFANNQIGIALAAAFPAGALLGFLWYNFRPATIFLGDSGSLFLGFILALLSIQSYTKASTTFALLVPIFALGLPIIDTGLSMIRRFFSWFLPEKNNGKDKLSYKKVFHSIFLPDKSHIHHQLINRGLSHKNTVLVLYVVSILFGFGAFMVAVADQFDTTFFIILLLVLFIKTGISRLKYNEMDLLHNGIFFAIYKSLILNKRHLRKFFDSAFILTAFACSSYLIYREQFIAFLNWNDSAEIATIFSLIFMIQLGAFWLTGLYKETIRRMGIADVFKILKSLSVAVVSTALIHYLFLTNYLPFNYLLYILDFYLLGTFILGIRVSFHILKHLFHKSRNHHRRVLIYGTDDQGLLALQCLLTVDSNHFTPVGFIDEDPRMEGRLINGFSVFGGHWKLEGLIQTKKIDELLIAKSILPPEVRKRIYKIARQYNLEIKLLQVQLKNLDTHLSDKKFNPDILSYAN